MNTHTKPTAFTTAPTRFVVIADFKNLGRSIVNEPDDTRKMIVEFIASGEWQNVVHVLELSEPNGLSGVVGTWRDVTEDVAREVRDQLVAAQIDIDWPMANWLHNRLGVQSVRWPRAAE